MRISYFWQKRAKIPNNPISPLIFDTSISIRGLYLTLRDLGLSKIDLTPKIGLEWYSFSQHENRSEWVHFFDTFLILKSCGLLCGLLSHIIPCNLEKLIFSLPIYLCIIIESASKWCNRSLLERTTCLLNLSSGSLYNNAKRGGINGQICLFPIFGKKEPK